jgi:predicted dehydrogenase
MSNGKFRLGVVGAGRFGLFALQHFIQIPGVELVGVAGTHRPAVISMARRFGISDIHDVDTLVQLPNIDLVYISTPPFLHYAQAMKALHAGKHVICEKPLAMTVEQADEMIATARERGQLMVANLMQRYNPLFDIIQKLVVSKALGEFLHGYFENYASDEDLPVDHWFWDRAKSGGIYIEHGVHFFDLFEGWLGAGKVVAAQRTLRPGTDLEEQVNCTVRYTGGALVNFYHSFTQPNRFDRQELRLLFERGDVVLNEWIPVRTQIRALADEASTRALMDLFPGAKLDVTRLYENKERQACARHKPLDIYQMIDIRYGLGEEKMPRYGELLRAMFRDQLEWIRNPDHQRKITEQNGRNSLAMAVMATEFAERISFSVNAED